MAILVVSWFLCCMFIPSPVREGSTICGDHRVLLICIELKPVRRVIADANLKRFQHKVFEARREPTLNIGELRVAQPIALLLRNQVCAQNEARLVRLQCCVVQGNVGLQQDLLVSHLSFIALLQHSLVATILSPWLRPRNGNLLILGLTFSQMKINYRVSQKKCPFVPLLVIQRDIFFGTPCS